MRNPEMAKLGESLLVWRSEFGGGEHVHTRWTIALGRSDARTTGASAASTP